MSNRRPVRSHRRDVFIIGKDAFWRDVFFSHRFVERMYKEALECTSVEILAESGDLSTGLARRLKFVQKVDMPAAIRKIFGETTTMEEDGRFDAATGRWRYRMIPDKMAEKIAIQGETWVEAVAGEEGKIARVVEVEFAVSMFGVGGLVEKFMASQTAASWERQARFIERYIGELGARAS